jgi:EAL domain-containing protein (putative c-di-GMP-specific phosphodiesterase class I)
LPPGPLADLMRELHDLHARAGWPSTRQLARGQRFSHTAVHDLFTKTTEPPRLPVLHRVVEQLAELAPRTDAESVLDRFDTLWRVADQHHFAAPTDAGDGHDELNRGGPRKLVSDLAGALFGGRLTTLFQPVVAWDGTVFCAEMLMRWQHPTRGLVVPNHFIPMADDAGLLRHLDTWALEAATSEAASWADESVDAPAVAVNISELLPGDHSTRQIAIDTVEHAGIDWGRVIVELSANAFLRASAEAVKSLTELTDRGARITLDDFGTDTSLLAQLRNLPVHAVNINRDLVAGIVHNPADRAMARAIIDLAHSAGHLAIVEGVETAEQLDVARQLGADAYQGHLISRPVPAPALRGLLRTGALPAPSSLCRAAGR